MKVVEILPGRSIGAVRLGIGINALPSGALLKDGAGSVDGVHFLVAGDVVSDVWIEDLHTFPNAVLFDGRTIPRDASLDAVKAVFGPCTKVQGIKGGVFFNCESGVAIGCDADESGRFIQIRVKHR